LKFHVMTGPGKIADQVMGTFTILALTLVEIGVTVVTVVTVVTEGMAEMVGMEENDDGFD
jgi:hypothetical protein